jgi:chemosensory pili system protein ChpA (sensor histidine kinase/response regulator)
MDIHTLARQRPLALVREQIRDSLDEAARHLDRFHQNPDQNSELDSCNARLCQVSGCLTMLELPGALCLTGEMQALLSAIGDPDRLTHERCCELLISAALFLPRYLDYVHSLGRETPALLLPTINLLRYVRRAGLIPEHAFVDHRLPLHVPPTPDSGMPAHDDLPRRIRSLRHQYQVGLIGVIRDHAPQSHLQLLSRTLARVQALCGQQPFNEVWQLALGLLEALGDDQLKLDFSARHMLGRVDRELRRLVDQGSALLARPMDPELRAHLLYYLAKADAAEGQVHALRVRYRLSGCVDSQRHLEQERQRLQSPDRGATAAVAEQLLDDLAQVKTGLLALQSSTEEPATGLRTLLGNLDQIALTLELLGLDQAMHQCRRIARQLPALAADGISANLTAMADQMVSIEIALQAYAEGVPRQSLNQDHCDHLRLAEENTLRVARQSLAGIRDTLEEHFDPYGPAAGQGPLPEALLPMLRQVEGALRMLELTELAELLQPLRALLGEQGRPLPAVGSRELTDMADAIASVEWFLEDYGRERRRAPAARMAEPAAMPD